MCICDQSGSEGGKRAALAWEPVADWLWPSWAAATGSSVCVKPPLVPTVSAHAGLLHPWMNYLLGMHDTTFAGLSQYISQLL